MSAPEATEARPWWKKRRFVLAIGGFVLLMIIAAATADPEAETTDAAATDTTVEAVEAFEEPTATEAQTMVTEAPTTSAEVIVTEAPTTTEVETFLVTCLGGSEFSVKVGFYDTGKAAYESTCSALDELFAPTGWEAQVLVIVEGDGTPMSKAGEIDQLVRADDWFTDDEAEILLSEMVEAFRSREFVTNSDKAYLFRLMFIASAVERSMDDADALPADGFAFDLYQAARDIARDVEEPDSDFVNAKPDQLDDAIAEQGW